MAVMITVLLLPAHLNVYAAGQITVKLGEVEGLDGDFPGFNFELYEVGGYSGSDFVLSDDFAKSGVKLPEASSEPDQEAWQKAADSLGNYIKHPDDGASIPSPVKTYENVQPGDSMNYNSDKNALFLLVSDTVRYNNQYFTPVAMFVRTLDGSETYTIDAALKIKITPVVFEHSLIKTWDDYDNADGVRPTAIEVGIYYGDQMIDRVKLGGSDGKWTYTWKSEESGDTYYYISEDNERKGFTPGDGNQSWGVREILNPDEIEDSEAKADAYKLAKYNPEYSMNTSGDMESFVINNPYCGENPPPEPDEPDKPGKKVKTGDENNPLLWCCLAGGAVVLLGGFMIVRRKRRDGEE